MANLESKTTFRQPYVSKAVTVDSNLNSLQGIKINDLTAGNPVSTYLLTGTTGNAFAAPGYGALYSGAIDGASTSTGSGSGTWYNFSVPSTWSPQETSVYGPDILTSGSGPNGIGDVALAGTWLNSQGKTIGWYYQGSISALSNDTTGAVSNGFKSFQATVSGTSNPANYTYLHSVDGGYVVGNYTTSDGVIALTLNTAPGSGSFIYNPRSQTQTNISYSDGAKYHTTFGIWANDNSTYTISGGASFNDRKLFSKKAISQIKTVLPDATLGKGMLADVDPITGTATNIHHYNYDNSRSRNILTHFQGIYYAGDNIYQAPYVATTATGKLYTGNAFIKRFDNGQFSKNAVWQKFEATSAGSALITTSAASDGNTGVFNSGANPPPPFASTSDIQPYLLAAQTLV
ncbi:hypothetical protein KBY58_12560 [Cyanobium sp. HWJ4-Hawea]|uniref:hypothetical protein n=1 Tax=Cyanobium sp. HWJ4-Hawea TaxID=2823713 RepID=UPI0020CC0FD6|nr:hypothetical protein [Cyanobium sp. HWJ4-Hawea]MCP9810259.1 hypothetical protein [Cyanobium sp. HWJ4-Hawea]